MGIMAYMRGFYPWIAAGFVSAVDWRWGAVAGVVVGVLLLLQDRRRGVAMDAMVLEISTIIYFVIIGVIAFSSPDSSIQDHSDVISFAWLAGTAWGSMALRSPSRSGSPVGRRSRSTGTPRVSSPSTTTSRPPGDPGSRSSPSSWPSAARPTPRLGRHRRPRRRPGRPAVFTSVYPKRVQARLEAMQAASA